MIKKKKVTNKNREEKKKKTANNKTVTGFLLHYVHTHRTTGVLTHAHTLGDDVSRCSEAQPARTRSTWKTV